MSIAQNNINSLQKPDFGKRIIALIIDLLLIGLLSFVLTNRIVDAILPAVPIEKYHLQLEYEYLFTIIVNAAIFFAYFVSFEHSNWQSTPGKRSLGLKIMNLHQQKPTFKQLLARNGLKMLIFSWPFFPFVLNLMDSDGTDYIAAIPVLYVGVLCVVVYQIANRDDGRNIFDFPSGCQVVKT